MSRGRPPEDGSTRDQVMCVRLTAKDVADIEKARGGAPKARFVRDAIRAEVRKRGVE